MTRVRVRTETILCDLCKEEGLPDARNAKQDIQPYTVSNGKTQRTVDLCRRHREPLDHLIELKHIARIPTISAKKASRARR